MSLPGGAARLVCAWLIVAFPARAGWHPGCNRGPQGDDGVVVVVVVVVMVVVVVGPAVRAP